MEQDNNSSIFSLSMDFQSSSVLKSAASWARLLAILGFVLAVLSVIIAVKMPSTMKAAPAMEGYGDPAANATATKMAGTIGLVTYCFMGLIFAISSTISLTFARKTNMALAANDSVTLTEAFSSLKNFFVLWTVLTILTVLLMLITVAGVIAM